MSEQGMTLTRALAAAQRCKRERDEARTDALTAKHNHGVCQERLEAVEVERDRLRGIVERSRETAKNAHDKFLRPCVKERNRLHEIAWTLSCVLDDVRNMYPGIENTPTVAKALAIDVRPPKAIAQEDDNE